MASKMKFRSLALSLRVFHLRKQQNNAQSNVVGFMLLKKNSLLK